MSPGKIDPIKLNQLLRQGKTVKLCAKFFGVTPGAVSQSKKKLNVSVVKNITLENAHRIVDKNLNTINPAIKYTMVKQHMLFSDA